MKLLFSLILSFFSFAQIGCSVQRQGNEYVDGVVVYRTGRHKNDFHTDCWTFFGLSLEWCAWTTTPTSYWKTYFRSTDLTRNMSYTELMAHCEDEFVCAENTGCYKDFVRFFRLDDCHDSTWRNGPMYFCIKTLLDVMKTNPNGLSECVRDHLDKTEINKKEQVNVLRNCQDIAEYQKCYLPAVETYCDAKVFTDFKTHMDLRLYNRACDGRLRYKDWDYTADHYNDVQVVPHGPVTAQVAVNDTDDYYATSKTPNQRENVH